MAEVKKIGCNLFGLSNIITTKGLGDILAQLKSFEFDSIEGILQIGDIYDKHNSTAPVEKSLKSVVWRKEEFKEKLSILKDIGLEMTSVHMFVYFEFHKNIQKIADEIINLKENTGINCYVMSLHFKDKTQCEQAAYGMNELNRLIADKGIALLYHNHDVECVQIIINKKSVSLLEYFIELTDDRIKLQVDAGWMLYAGMDAVNFINQNQGRIVSIHFKDILNLPNPMKTPKFTAVGTGALPVRSLLHAAEELFLMPNGIIIDQDAPSEGSDIMTDLKTGIKNLKKAINFEITS